MSATLVFFFFSSRRRHTRYIGDWSSDVCSSDLNWSGVITLKEGHELIERGPYRVVRHPIYTGILAMFAGTAIAVGYLGGSLGLLLVFVSFWLKLKREED